MDNIDLMLIAVMANIITIWIVVLGNSDKK